MLVRVLFSNQDPELIYSKDYMIAVEDSDFDAAVEALHHAGFRDAPWSYGSTADPQSFQDKRLQEIHRHTALGYRNLNRNSRRLGFPLESGVRERAVLLPSSYVHLSLSSTPQSRFIRVENLHSPDGELLLESFVRTRIRESDVGLWTLDLEMWAVSYLYGQLMLGDDALDSSSDEPAKTWFNDNIRRDSGGIDRTTVTKRVGKRLTTTNIGVS